MGHEDARDEGTTEGLGSCGGSQWQRVSVLRELEQRRAQHRMLGLRKGRSGLKEVHGGCEQLVFASNGTFAAMNPTLNGDTGTWSGGKSTITVDWTGGLDAGLVFSGTFVPEKGYYIGTISPGMGTLKCRLVDRAIPLLTSHTWSQVCLQTMPSPERSPWEAPRGIRQPPLMALGPECVVSI